MKRLAVALSLVVATVTIAAQAYPEWVRFRSPEGRCSVLVPVSPTLSAQETKASTGEKFTQYLATVEEGNSAFLLSYFDFTPSMTVTLSKSRDGMLAALKATLVSESQISLGGSPGLEMAFSCKIGDIDYVGRSRIYSIGTRVYAIEVLMPKSEAPAWKFDRFFDSFQVTATPF
jgi:hypothetical protein